MTASKWNIWASNIMDSERKNINILISYTFIGKGATKPHGRDMQIQNTICILFNIYLNTKNKIAHFDKSLLQKSLP